MAITHTHAEERRITPDRRAGGASTLKRTSTLPSASTSRLSTLGWIALGLVIIGGINWGLVGFLGIDLVAILFGPMSVASRIVYALVGLSALYSIYSCMKLAGDRRI